jgi:SpoVK/Ycf46/Vps4 family AAA+-type ATPase
MPGTIVATAKSARAIAPTVSLDSVHQGLQAHLDHQLSSVATRITCTQRWSDLVLPPDQLEQVVELVSRVKHRATVLEQWGFARKVGRGLGVSALLSGPPGTGKTMVAGLVARELGLDLYQVDLSKVVSKYIGETEKNLAKVFEAAEIGHALVLFDEADSLFAKRTAVSSSNDRYANLEVNYLLQRLEQFSGVAMLTTNHEAAIDPAFRRRLAVHLRLSMPDEAQRSEFWRAVLPAEAPVEDDLDFEGLGREFAMTGGYIKNAVLRAAYLAAHERKPISAGHLQRGARAEIEAMGKVVRA